VTTEAKTHRALIVEDTDDIAGLMQFTLRRMGIESHHASSGFTALAYLEQNTPDIMLLDINMPGMTGWDVLEALKTRAPEVSFPVIVLTALTDPANRMIGKLQSHVVRYLTKPFDMDVFEAAVREALGIT
jgi:DNA-binding response OmpR family regulator